MSLENCINLLHAKREYRIASEQKCKESDVLNKLRHFSSTVETEYASLASLVSQLDCPYLASFKNISISHVVKAIFGDYLFLSDLRFDLLK